MKQYTHEQHVIAAEIVAFQKRVTRSSRQAAVVLAVALVPLVALVATGEMTNDDFDAAVQYIVDARAGRKPAALSPDAGAAVEAVVNAEQECERFAARLDYTSDDVTTAFEGMLLSCRAVNAGFTDVAEAEALGTPKGAA